MTFVKMHFPRDSLEEFGLMLLLTVGGGCRLLTCLKVIFFFFSRIRLLTILFFLFSLWNKSGPQQKVVKIP